MFGGQQVVVPELLLAHQVSFEYLSDVAVVSLHKVHHTLPVAGAQRLYLFPNICIAKGDQHGVQWSTCRGSSPGET